jgi:two-component system, sensor histidine kinase and response regulator
MSSHILIVDDNIDDRWSLAEIVNRVMHHNVSEASDGLEAINMAGDAGYDLILLDLNLPKLQGWDVAKSLREMKNYAETPIIAITAYDMGEARSASLQSGCNVYMTKPIDVDTLIRVISQYLDPAA